MIRQGKEEDLPFIYSTWLRNYKHSSDFAKEIAPAVYYKFHQAAIERIIKRGALVLMAVDNEAPDVIWGWAVVEKTPEADIVHYLYVKKAFRGLGVGTELLQMAQVNPTKLAYSHITTAGKKFLEGVAKSNALYIPYAI